ncbi:MAG: BlaI/MecI/CopY family transcriptional regulator [Vicinamibacterales bacterium]
MKPSTSIGDRELALLKFVAARRGATVGEAAEGFGAERSLARSTVLTMMERLRRKGYLTRHRVDGVYQYRSPSTPRQLLSQAVKNFVERRLGGSTSPLVAYFSEHGDVSDDELRQLERLVSALREERRRGSR